MNIKINSNFKFSVSSIQYSPQGELCITLAAEEKEADCRYQYTASLGSGQSEESPSVSLLQYAKAFAANSNIKSKTKDTYRLMCKHLEVFGDMPLENVTTADDGCPKR